MSEIEVYMFLAFVISLILVWLFTDWSKLN